jgi:hypothetical protein
MHVGNKFRPVTGYVMHTPEDGLRSARSVDVICNFIEKNKMLVTEAFPGFE